MLEIVPATTPEQLAAVRELFLEYVQAVNYSLNLQTFDRDITQLPGEYAPPEGRLYMALWDDAPAGCVALKKIAPGTCELKRMWVKPEFRRRRIGRAMAERLIDDARHIGYRKMVLDTIDTLTEAIALYKSLGFQETEPYYRNPIEGATYFEMVLSEAEKK